MNEFGIQQILTYRPNLRKIEIAAPETILKSYDYHIVAAQLITRSAPAGGLVSFRY